MQLSAVKHDVEVRAVKSVPFEYPQSKPLKIRYSCGNMSCAAITQARRHASPDAAHRKSQRPTPGTARTSLSQS